MSYSRRSRYYDSPSPYARHSRSVSRSPSRSRSRSCDSSDAENPGNNLYVTGLPSRVTKRDIEKHFSTEGKVENVHLVIDPRTRESRGFGFVTMSTLEEADRCIKYLDRTVFEGRVTVEKAKRGRGRTPTPGRYLGLKTVRGGGRRSPSYSTYSRSRSRSRGRSRSRSRSRSYSPYYGGRRRSYSPAYSRRRRSSYSPDERCYSRRRRSPSYYSRSPLRRRRERSYDYSPNDSYYRRSYNRDYSPDTRYRSLRDYSPNDHSYDRGRSRYNTTEVFHLGIGGVVQVIRLAGVTTHEACHRGVATRKVCLHLLGEDQDQGGTSMMGREVYPVVVQRGRMNLDLQEDTLEVLVVLLPLLVLLLLPNLLHRFHSMFVVVLLG